MWRKRLVLGIIFLFLGMSIISSNAVNIQKETLSDEKTTGEYTLHVTIFLDGIDPIPPGPIFPNKAVVTHENNPSFKIVIYNWMPIFSIKIPEYFKYPDVNIYAFSYEQIRSYYYNYKDLVIYIKWVDLPRTLNNPFINRLPILAQLLQLAVR
jgi:hypothetical protein